MAQPLPLTHASVLRIAVPIMLSNVSEPMIGVVNTAVMGRLPQPYYIGAIAVGSLIFSFLFWGFGFLRLSTSGLAAQATGAKDDDSLVLVVCRSVILAACIGLLLVALGPWLAVWSVGLIGGSAEVMREATTYFNYRIWSAPAALTNFAVLGWFIGQGRASLAFFTQLFLNLGNMALSILFVLGLGMTTEGVGLAVVIAEYATAVLGLALVILNIRKTAVVVSPDKVFRRKPFAALIAANTDIMIRTFCLVFAFGWFVSKGARQGDLVVAANAVLLNLFEVSAYMIDGFAYASEALVGQAIGARDPARYGLAIRLTTLWALCIGVLCSLAIWVFGPQLVGLMTVNPEVIAMAMVFLPWAAVTPLLGTICFQFDGIFTGAMATREMRNMMILSLAIFLASYFVLAPRYGNHGLWAALSIFFIARGVTFAWQMPVLHRKAFGAT